MRLLCTIPQQVLFSSYHMSQTSQETLYKLFHFSFPTSSPSVANLFLYCSLTTSHLYLAPPTSLATSPRPTFYDSWKKKKTVFLKLSRQRQTKALPCNLPKTENDISCQVKHYFYIFVSFQTQLSVVEYL